MSFAAGAATFNSCDKHGSIAQFTEHLRTHPNDYKALIWRAKAHSIVGNGQKALRDLRHAISVSRGVEQAVAIGEFVRLSTCSIEKFGEHANGTVNRYEDKWIAWNQLGQYNSMRNDDEKATKCWENSLSLATTNRETTDPHICWINYGVGNNRLKGGNVVSAKRYYTNAVDSCSSHTVSHIQLCHCNIMQGNLNEARDNFTTALQLNQTLCSSVFGTNSFDEYLQSILQKSMDTLALVHTSKSASASGSSMKHFAKDASGRTRFGSGGAAGGGGNGGGNGSDDEDTDVSAVWKKLQKEALCIKMYGGHKYVQSKCGGYWYSRDTAGHGGAQFKRYEDTGNSLRFLDSVDAKLKPMSGKHESRENTFIMKSKMVGVKGK